MFGPNTTSSGGDTHRAEFSLGASSSKWHSVWSAMGSIQTSDINCKENIKNVVAEEKVKKEPDKDLSVFYSDIENKLKSILGAKIAIKASNNNKGKIEINYYSQDELDRIIDMILTIQK